MARYNEGSAALQRALNREKGEALRGQAPPPDLVGRRRETARALGLRPPPHPGGRPWTAEELALLGMASDAEVAARTGRTETAARGRRAKLGLPTARDRRTKRGSRR